MMHTLPDLPYAYDALEPYIDARTMEIHHTKHHQAYIDKLNAAIKDYRNLHDQKAEQLIGDLGKIPDAIRAAVRNHGGGHANHSFFWPMLKKDAPYGGPLSKAIEQTFGGFERFKTAFSNAAILLFGSGWAWLVAGGDRLEIITTSNQDSPLSMGKMPIIGVDVWEHAYYLKYQNKRPDYIAAFFNVINWERANENFERLQSS